MFRTSWQGRALIRRIILHAGTEKTGTTALQLFMEEHAATLASQGVFYPSTGEDYRRTSRFPKHRWLIEALMADTSARFERELDQALARSPGDAHSLVLSDEALHGDWPHVSRAGRAALGALAERFETELWVWFREPVSFARSEYVQMLKNPPGGPPGNGRDVGIQAAIELPWFVSRLDYIGFVRDLESVLGAGRVRPFVYQGDSIAAFLLALGLEDTAARKRRENASVGRSGVAWLRRVNRYRMEPAARTVLLRLIGRMDGLLARRRPLALSRQTTARILELAAPSIAGLATDYGLVFEPD